MAQLRQCIETYIYADTTIDVTDIEEIRKRAKRVFLNEPYGLLLKFSKFYF